MGFWSDVIRGGIPTAWMQPRVEYINNSSDAFPSSLAGLADPGQLSVSQLWATQPHLRTVITFRARNVAQLGLHVFERVSDTDRRRDQSSPLTVALRRPDLAMTVYDLIFSLVGDLDLYDRAYWLVATAEDSRPLLRRLPPSWVEPIFSDPFTVKSYRVKRGARFVDVAPDQVLAFSGYAPASPIGASPTIESLKDTLREQIEASAYRAQVWKRGGRVSAVLERPKDAPQWSEGAREAFREDWYAKFTGRGAKAGGTPILEDGMTLRRIDFNAQEQQFVDVAKLALATVASAYHVNPTMIGLLDNANYSNVREFRRMLYGDTLGPLLAQIEARINAFLLPMLGMDPERYYAEFNLQEKLQGSFEEQAAVMSTMVGRPLMTADEGRARFNLPAMGGDAEQLVTPLNVLVGGQASAQDSGSQNRTDGQRVGESAAAPNLKGRAKSRAPEAQEERFADLLKSFFERQGRVVQSRMGAGEDWWDAKRWDDELSADLLRMYALSSETAARSALEAAGVEGYEVDQTLAFLSEAARLSAGDINEATKGQLDEAIADPDGDPETVFENAQSQRALEIAATAVTFASGFGVVEAAKQNGAGTKTWRTTSSNPRSSHARLNGETVPLDDDFSNGLKWPGSIGDPAETAGCKCAVDINF